MQGTGQLPPVVGQMVSVTVGQLPDQAMVAEETQMPAHASRELPVSSSGAPRGGAEFLPQSGIGDARDGEAWVADGVQEFAIFAAEVQSANTTAIDGYFIFPSLILNK